MTQIIKMETNQIMILKDMLPNAPRRKSLRCTLFPDTRLGSAFTLLRSGLDERFGRGMLKLKKPQTVSCCFRLVVPRLDVFDRGLYFDNRAF